MKIQLQNSLLSFTLALFIGGVSTAHAAPGEISQSPLFLQTSVPPNVFFLNDNSGSMRAELMTEDFDNSGNLASNSDNLSPPLLHTGDCSDDDDERIYSFILQTDTEDCNRVAEEEWRARHYDYNKLYYDPSQTYKPWTGKSDITDITNVPINPMDISAGTIDLTQDSAVLVEVAVLENGVPTEVVYERSYYDSSAWGTWCSNQGISSADCVGWRYYDLDDNNNLTITWVKNLPGVSTDESNPDSQQNFANWFAYHRSREFSAKYAISQAIDLSDLPRIGYGTINEYGNNLHIDYLTAKVDSNDPTTHKQDLLNKLFNTISVPHFSTPLRNSLKSVGNYYDANTTSNFFIGNNTSPIIDACQSNNTILITDGFYNGADPDIGNIDLAEGAPYADNYADTLADVAMYYYKTDLSNLPDLSATLSDDDLKLLVKERDYTDDRSDTARHQHMNTHTLAFGLKGSIDPDTADINAAGFSWPNPTINTNRQERIDDLFHAAVNGRGNYFSASDPDELVQALLTIIDNIGEPEPSAASVSMSSFQLESGSLIFSSEFTPGDWDGDLLAYKITFNSDGTFGFAEEWSAASKLNNLTNYNNRNIYTYKENASGNGSGVLFDWASIEKASSGDPDLQALLNHGDSAAVGENRLKYLRGENISGFRQRTSLLGDIVNASPVYVSAPASPYPDAAPYGAEGNRYSKFWNDNKTRTPVIYVGANDGMLHGFRAQETTVGAGDDGEELMAYVPATVFPNLYKLTDPNYVHRYFVDQTPTIADAYYNSAWHTVLIGGLGAGGKGLFALDITDPDNFGADDVLWEFNSADEAIDVTNPNDFSDFGDSLSKPVVALTNEGWVVIVGNGYNSDSGIAKLYIIKLNPDLDNGWTLDTDYFEISTEVGDTTNKNGLSSPTPVDTDGDGYTDRVYAGDLQGNLWAFDLSGNNSNWDVAYDDGTNPVPLFHAENANGQSQPITVKPSVIRHPAQPTIINQSDDSTNTFPNLMIYFGTGQYLTIDDLNNTETQTFYGVWDKGDSNLTRNNLVKKAINSGTDSALSVTARITAQGDVLYGLSDNTVRFGWLIDLIDADPEKAISGERVVTNAVVINDIVFFTTYIPTSDACSPGGDSWFMFVNALNGGTPDEPIINLTNDRTVNTEDMVTLATGDEAEVPSGLKIQGTLGAPSLDFGDGNTGTALLITDDLDPEKFLKGFVTDVGSGALGKRMSWRELRDE